MAVLSSPFSDVEWIRRDIPSITEDDMEDSDVNQAIEDGDLEIKDDFSSMIDWTVIETLPEAIRRLSHYKACELVLLRAISTAAVVAEENSLVKYWADKYNNLKKDIFSGKIKLISTTGADIAEDEVTRKFPPIGRII